MQMRFVALVAALVVMAEASAQAEDGVDEAQMQAEMHRYFAGERRGGGWLMGVGAVTAAAGSGLLIQSGELGRGLAYPLLVIGAIELVGGLVFTVNTNRRVPRFDQQLHTQPAAFRDGELARIQGVNRDMHRLEVAELTLMIASGTLTGVGALQGRDLLTGVGAGLLIQTAVLFVYDQFAARRARRYTDSLLRFRFAPSSH